MITLTQTIVDIADCNVTLRYFTAPAPGTMPFSGAGPYETLYAQIAQQVPHYEQVCGAKGNVLEQLRPVYAPNKFWNRYFLSGDVIDYPARVWSRLVPISATLRERLEVILPPALAAMTISPVPRVLLHPFGWSTWLSMRITGSYTLEDLAGLVSYLFTGPAYRYDSNPAAAMTLTQLLGGIRKGVEGDAFGGKAETATPPDLLTVTTVLAKHGGGVSLGALSNEQEQSLQKLVRPGKPAKNKSVKTMAEALPLGGDPLLDYVLHDGMSWFIWAEHLLKPESRLFRHLRCYHNNTFRSLLQAWLVETLFKQASKMKPWTPELTALLDSAVTLLDSSEGLNDYKNRSLLTFLVSPGFTKAAQTVRQRLTP